MPADTLARMFWDRVERSADPPAQQFKQGGAWQTLTWREVGDSVREVATGLIALGREEGRGRGHPVGQPRRVGAGRLRDLLGRLRDDPGLPDVPARPDRSTSSTTRG